MPRLANWRWKMIPVQAGDKLFRGSAHQGGIAERKKMIDRKHKLSLTGQAKTLGISRGSVYYCPRPVSAAGLALMRRIDELHLDYPFAGSRMLQGLLLGEGYQVGRLHVATLMKRMGLEAIYRRPNTSKPAPGHKIYPYLLRKLPVTRANQSLPPRRRGSGRWISPTVRLDPDDPGWRMSGMLFEKGGIIGSLFPAVRGFEPKRR